MRQIGYLIAPLLLTMNACSGPTETVADDTGLAAKSVDAAIPTDLPNLWTRMTGSDWPVFLGPTGDSKTSETGILAPWPATGPRIVWQREVGSGYGIGTTSRGRYFHFDRWDERAGGRGLARLTCMNAETGEELWKFEYPSEYRDTFGYNNGPRCSPVIDGDRVYIFGVEGMLHCLRTSDGRLIWSLNTEERFGVVKNFFGVGSTPVVEGDLLLCMIGGSPSGSPPLESNAPVNGNGTGIVAFNKYTGKVEYEITDELAGYASPKLATIDGRRWCFMFCRGGLVGFEPSTGKVDFEYPWRSQMLESVNASTPVVVGNEVFISETYQIGSSLLAVRPGGFDIVWRDERNRREKAMKTHWNTPVYVDGYLYGCSGRNSPDADLRCIEWKTGKVMWIEQEPPPRRERSALLYVDGHFVCLGEYGTLKLIKANPKEYELVSEVMLLRDEDNPLGPRPLLKYPCWAAPILSKGLLYVRGDDRIVCLELIPEKKLSE